MKVLFALGSEQTSKRVAEKYYEKFGEELEYKNVFYFKALLEEVKNDKTYDRIVISEELEQFHVKNLESLDKFIFNNIDNITDEIENSEVIFICSDRRNKQDDRFVERLFNIGVYNTLIGDERKIEPLCNYIKKPLNKKEAKRHLNITSVVSDDTLSTSDDTVEEVQIMNILKYYDRIKGKVDEYVPAFDKIAEQYSINQLKVIINFLPGDVKNEILSSTRYAYLSDGIPIDNNISKQSKNAINYKPNKKGLFGILKDNKSKENEIKQPRVIVEASAHKVQEELRVKAEQEAMEREQQELRARAEQEAKAREQQELRARAEQEAKAREQAELRAKAEQEAKAREQQELRARAEQEAKAREQQELRARAEQEAKAREQQELRAKAEQEAKAREQQELRVKAEMEAKMVDNHSNDNRTFETIHEITNINDNSSNQYTVRDEVSEDNRDKLQEMLEREKQKLEAEKLALEEEKRKLREQTAQLNRDNESNVKQTASSYVSKLATNVNNISNRMIVLVGANKSGTTFLVNAISHSFADSRINTGVLDMTRDKSLYYIYNQDDKELRKIANECMQKLSENVDSYIPAKRNLKIYTTVPGPSSDSRRAYRNRTIIETVKNSNNIVVVDADFSTPLEYFEKADEIYIVQDLDIIRMQETTLFLRELKNRSISMNKVKVIINKYVKTMLSPKKLIQGLSYYNDPQMSFVDELLDSKVSYYIVPFSVENYSKYIDGIYKNEIDFKKFTPDFLDSINEIANNIYNKNNKKKKGIFG